MTMYDYVWTLGCVEKLKNTKSNYGYSYFIAPWYIETEKLRDVLQEREGTSLNYLEIFSNYIEQFSLLQRSEKFWGRHPPS